jgi:hypothetical protein
VPNEVWFGVDERPESVWKDGLALPRHVKNAGSKTFYVISGIASLLALGTRRLVGTRNELLTEHVNWMRAPCVMKSDVDLNSFNVLELIEDEVVL